MLGVYVSMGQFKYRPMYQYQISAATPAELLCVNSIRECAEKELNTIA